MGNLLRQKSAVALILLALCGCYRENHRAWGQRSPNNDRGGIPERPHRDGDDQAPVPEPATIALLGGGLAALAAARRKRKKNG